MTETVEVVVRADAAQFAREMQGIQDDLKGLGRASGAFPAKAKTAFDRREVRGYGDELVKTNKEFQKLAATRGKRGMGAVAGAAVGGAAGFAAGALLTNSPVTSMLELVTNVLAGALLPVLVALMPILQAVATAIEPVVAALTPLVTAIAETLAPVLGAVADLLAPLVELLGIVLAPALEVITAVLTPILETLATAVQGLVNFLKNPKETVKEVGNFVSDVLTDIMTPSVSGPGLSTRAAAGMTMDAPTMFQSGVRPKQGPITAEEVGYAASRLGIDSRTGGIYGESYGPWMTRDSLTDPDVGISPFGSQRRLVTLGMGGG